jgi:hypothetical protein
VKSEIDNDLLVDKSNDDETEEDQNDCTFCAYQKGKLTKEELRLLWGLHDSATQRVNCSTCNKIIEF